MDTKLRSTEKDYKMYPSRENEEQYSHEMKRHGIDYDYHWIFDRGNWSKLIFSKGDKYAWLKIEEEPCEFAKRHGFSCVTALVSKPVISYAAEHPESNCRGVGEITIFEHENRLNTEFYAMAVIDFFGDSWDIVFIKDYPSLWVFLKECSPVLDSLAAYKREPLGL